MARIYVRACHDKDRIYRQWNMTHGAVCPTASKDVQPNRQELNPALQVQAIAADNGNVHAHITSLKPFDPSNAPDKWEQKALFAFEKGEKEANVVLCKDGEHTARLMRPLYVQ